MSTMIITKKEVRTRSIWDKGREMFCLHDKALRSDESDLAGYIGNQKWRASVILSCQLPSPFL